MKNKQTVLVFANESTEVFARAIKERLSHIKDALCIIIGENEFVSTGLQIAKDLLLNPDGIVIKTAKKILEGGPDRGIDRILSSDITYTDRSVSFVKMRNVFRRYEPKAVVLMSGALAKEALAVRAKFAPDVKVFMLVKDFGIHCGIINHNIDKFFVENMAILTTLANYGVKERQIAVTNIPVPAEFDNAIPKDEAAKTLNLDAQKPVLLFRGGDKLTPSDKTALIELTEFSKRANVLVYCGTNRKLFEFASSLRLKAFNEGYDLNMLYSAADLLITRPVSQNILVALHKKLLCVVIPPSDKLEERSIKGLKGLVIDATAKGGMVTFIDDYLRTPGFEKTYKSVTQEMAERLKRPAAGALIEAITNTFEPEGDKK